MSSPKAPPPPPAPKPQPAPNYGAAARESIYADIETLPARREIEAAAMFGDAGSVQVGKKTVDYDFAGRSDADLTKKQQEINKETAFAQADMLLELQEAYGSEFVEKARQQLKESDPEGFDAREKLYEAVIGDLEAGYSLNPEFERELEQDIRGAQVARGNYMGSAPVTSEAAYKGEARQRLRQQRLGNVGAFLSGTTPTAQFGSISGAQAGAAPWAPANPVRGTGPNPNASAQGAAFASDIYKTQMGYNSSIYGTQMSGYNAGLSYQSSQGNPWMQVAGMGVGLATSFI